jgi:hypothetical protein
MKKKKKKYSDKELRRIAYGDLYVPVPLLQAGTRRRATLLMPIKVILSYEELAKTPASRILEKFYDRYSRDTEEVKSRKGK